MRIFVNGHRSFDAAWLMKPFLQRGFEVFGFDSDSRGHSFEAVLGELQNSCQQQFGDPLSVVELKQALDYCKPDIVFHLYNSTHSKSFLRDEDFHQKHTVQSTQALLEALEGGASLRLLAAYVSDRDNGADAHSLAHLQREQLIKQTRLQSGRIQGGPGEGMKTLVMTWGSLIGPGDLREESFIPQMIQKLLSGEEYAIRKPHSVRSFQPAQNLSQLSFKVVSSLIENPEICPEKICFGPSSKDMESVGNIAWQVALALKQEKLLVMPPQTRGASYHPSPSRVELEKLLQGDLNERSLQDCLQETISWYQNYYAL